MLSITRELSFSNHRWGAALEQISASHDLPDGEGDQPTDHFILTKAGPALLMFARALFPGIEASWEDRNSVHVGKYSARGDRLTCEHLDLLHQAWIRPESLRELALLLCDGELGLMSHAGIPFTAANLRTATEVVRSELQLAFPGLVADGVSLVEVKRGWSSGGKKGGRHPCGYSML